MPENKLVFQRHGRILYCRTYKVTRDQEVCKEFSICRSLSSPDKSSMCNVLCRFYEFPIVECFSIYNMATMIIHRKELYT